MRYLVMIPFLVACSYGTPTAQKVPVVHYYARHDRLGPFFMRWYWRAQGMSTSAGSETLILMANHRFQHCSSTIHLSGCYFGTWAKKEDTLVLKADSAQGLMPEPFEVTFLIDKKRLRSSDWKPKGGEWIMKRKNLGSLTIFVVRVFSCIFNQNPFKPIGSLSVNCEYLF